MRAEATHQLLEEIWKRPRLTYTSSVVLSLAAFGLHRAFEPVIAGHLEFLFYVPAVVAAAFFGGLGPGLVATACSIALILLRGREYDPRIGVPVFLVCGLTASVLSEMARRTVRANANLRKAREQVLTIVAHDLRNPLNAVVLNARSLRNVRSPETARAVASIERNAARMEHLIRDLVDAARLEAGQEFVVVPQDEDASSLVRQALESCEPQAHARGISLELSLPGEIAPLRCDRERILQVLENLLGNAIKFTPVGGQITLRLAKDAGSLRFEVADNGPGIAPADMPRLFERHWKGRASSGTGLGLYIAAGIVRAHGGRIWCHSEPGYGASFFFTVPVSRRASHAPADVDRLHLS